RLSYNPECPPRVWDEAFNRRFGDAGPDVLDMTVWMSRIVPLIYAAHCLGPDHRDMAPELETGGDINEFGAVQAFDDTTISSPAEYAEEVLARRPSGRMTPLDAAALLLERSQKALAAAEAADRSLRNLPDSSPAWQEFDCLRADADARSHLAGYYAEKLRASVELELFNRAKHLPHLDAARAYAARAADEWRALAQVTGRHYRPFPDTLRMHTQNFHWRNLTSTVEQDVAKLDAMKASLFADLPAAGEPPLIGHVPMLRLEPGRSLRVEATVLSAADVESAVLHYRSRGGDFATLAMRPAQGERRYFAVIAGADIGAGRLEYYIEVAGGGATAVSPEQGANLPYVVEVSADAEAPGISDLRADHAPGAETAEISAVVADASPLRSVRVYYKPLPSTVKWQSAPMTERDGRFRAEVPVTSEGLLYFVRAVDAALNASMSPDFLGETPYRVIAPWPREGEGNRYTRAQ
ncbi:MAG: hypothetical protein JSV65_18030, partial [Armatimonadota bacterium]